MNQIKEAEMQNLFSDFNHFIHEVRLGDKKGGARWITNAYIRVYLRVLKSNWNIIDFPCEACLVIATVGVEEKYRRQGVFTQVLKTLENINPFKVLGVECVSPSSFELRQCLIKEGFLPIPHPHLSNHFYKTNDPHKPFTQ